MTSFFKRIGDAAKKAKDALEESGVVDDVKEIVDDAVEAVKAKTSAPSAATPAEDREIQVPPGIVDPASLIGRSDVLEVTGIVLDNRYPYEDEGWIGTILTATDPEESSYFELRAAKGDQSGSFDPVGRWADLRHQVDPQHEVQDLGEEAFRASADTVYFRNKGQVLHTVANFGGDPNTAPWVEELARLAVDRI